MPADMPEPNFETLESEIRARNLRAISHHQDRMIAWGTAATLSWLIELQIVVQYSTETPTQASLGRLLASTAATWYTTSASLFHYRQVQDTPYV